MSEDQREENRKDLEMVQAKINFLRNPRHVPPSAPLGSRSLVQASKKKPKEIGIRQDPEPISTDSVVFVPSPPVVEFKNYKVGEVYEITLELKNMSSVMRQCRVLPPSSNIFSIGLGQFPGESGLVAPGMSCKYDVRFAPDSLKDYDDHITVQTQATEPIIVPLRGRRPPPVLTLPSEVDLGNCLVGGIQATQLLVKNEGGPGRFCLMTKNKWPTTSIRTVIPNITKITIKQAPFEIHPATFELGPGQSTVLEVLFQPQSDKVFTQDMIICCDNCHASNFRLKGEGEYAKIGLAEVEMGLSDYSPSEFRDISAQNLLRFDELNPFTYTERLVKVVNHTKVELPFQWMVYKPIMPKTGPCNPPQEPSKVHLNRQQEEDRVPDMEAAFSVFPNNGILQPSEIAQFRVTFAPPTEGDYHNVVHMMLQHIPPSIESSFAAALLHAKSSEIVSRTTVIEQGTFSDTEENINFFPSNVLRDVTGLELEVKAKCIPLSVVLHPYAIFMHVPVLQGSTIKRLFTMANHSYSTITFQWEPYTDSYLLEVEPPFGELDPGMAMDLEISITGVEPGTISHTLYCYVMNMPEPLHLHVQATVKGPELKLAQPSVDFGLVQVGQQVEKELTIINTSQVMVKFSITDTPEHLETDDPMAPSDLTLSEMSGELKPLERRQIVMTFSPTLPRTMKRVCQVEYEGGQPCSIGVYGEAQNPVVCFLECEKFLPEVYLDVPVVFKAVLHNQTLIPTSFHWKPVEGAQKKDCTVEIEELEGKIESWEQRSVSIAFTPHKAMSFSEVRLPCTIEGQTDNIYLNITCDVRTLEVSFKTSTDTHLLSDQMKVDFGECVPLGETVKRYVHICNQTAITAPFTVGLEKFTATLPVPPPEATTAGTARSRGRNLLSRTPNIADPISKTETKAMEEYNKFILSEKNGLAFVVYPLSGKLQPFGESIIEITAHSNMWGKYQDNIIFKVGYLEPVPILATITVVGCPLNFQLTAGQAEHKAVVRFGSHVSGAEPITRKLKINNTSPKDIRVDWEMFEDAPESKKLVDFITCFGRAFPPQDAKGNEIINPYPVKTESLHVPSSMDFIPNSPDTYQTMSLSSVMQSHISSGYEEDNPKIISCFLRPHLGDFSTRPFSISPKQLTIPGEGSSTVELTFTPLPTNDVPEEKDCVGFAFGYLSLDQEDQCGGKVTRPEAYAAELLRLDFTAHLKPALLTVEETDDEGMVYRSAMSDIMKNDLIKPEALRVCSTMLSNNTLTPLTFRLKVKDPWTLVDLDPVCTKDSASRAKDTLPCTLNPRHNLMVKVAFRVTPSLVLKASSKAKNLILTESSTGDKLNFQDVLHIQFENGAEQAVPLYASLAIPQFELSADILDFGTCLVGQTREQELTISNITASHSFWTISFENKSEFCDENTFQITPTEGRLEAHVTHISNSKATIKVFFTAGHSESYDCTFIVQGLLGEQSRLLHVYGNGSYDGKHEAVLNI
ncbi:hypothetical protein EGW08_009443 [Elysia chlorotica]|uniref:Abnormal spindle-like microcephaly-associated protein ASH domain-containing protein n=1 Tax=Elysia chlorotica TaxID=188477 RepID=A0A433TMG7_ELYCH|nr:hypothetical protein EGW08_009443 [Elysia chlorotica]